MKLKKRLNILLMMVLIVSMLAVACSSESGNNASNSGQTGNDVGKVSSEDGTKTSDNEEIIDIEVWATNSGKLEIKKGSPLYEFYVDKLGVGVIHPYVDWNGGAGYLDALNLKIAAGEMPDLFLPFGGMEKDLARNGAIADLTDLLPEHAPILWDLIPQQVWDVVRANDPTGEGRIYYVPGFRDYGIQGGLIR